MTYLIKFNYYTDTLKYLKWLQKITPVLSKKSLTRSNSVTITTVDLDQIMILD